MAKGRMPEKEPAERPRAKLALDRFAWEGWLNVGDDRWSNVRDEPWLKVGDALHVIMGVRGVDRSQARTHLIEAASDSVQSRYVVSLSSQDVGSLSRRAPT